MNDLFEAYVSALLRKALAPEGYEVVSQGGLRYCLNEITPDGAWGGPCSAPSRTAWCA